MSDSSIRLRPINDLLLNEDGAPTQFWIPAYQRGYRWKPLQVTQLLDDIWEFIQNSEGGKKEAFYCLQPLVIRQLDDGRCEVVDGQQRLTTIYILLTYLQEIAKMLGKQRFVITFETRGEANEPFLKSIDLSRSEENVDFFHICEAYKAIEDWFSGRDTMHKLKLLQHLLNDDEAGRNVQVIWFQLSDNDNPIDAFTRLNVGKIPLTNDELIRALFLRRDPSEESEGESTQLRIAYEWDQLEKALQSDPFWYFLNNQSGIRENRIGFLFELVTLADGLPEGAKDDTYEIFYAYNKKLKESPNRAEAEWLKIKQTFMLLEEWYEDRRLYHIIGFLIQQGMKISELRVLAEADTKDVFEAALLQEVFKWTIDEDILIQEQGEDSLKELIQDAVSSLNYRGSKPAIRSMLLLFNIATLLDSSASNIRFQFDSFKQAQWDIEHVRSISDEPPSRHNERAEWLKPALGYLFGQGQEAELQVEIQAYLELEKSEEADEVFDTLYGKVLSAFKEAEEEDTDHGIGNLALLDQGTNRSYQNAVFAVKRQRLLEIDQAGIFVPLCTRNVFLKCYSPQIDNVMFWTKDDRNAYQETIVGTLHRFFLAKEGDLL